MGEESRLFVVSVDQLQGHPVGDACPAALEKASLWGPCRLPYGATAGFLMGSLRQVVGSAPLQRSLRTLDAVLQAPPHPRLCSVPQDSGWSKKEMVFCGWGN